MIEFVFIGYMLRNIFSLPLENFKTPSRCVTADTALCKLHPVSAKHQWEEIGGILNPTTLRTGLTELEIAYSALPDGEKSAYCIYGYAMETERIDTITQSVVQGEKEETLPKFAYAQKLNLNVDPRFRLLGFEVVDANMEWLSAQSNCGYHHTELEQFGRVNEHNLFVDYAGAKKFRDFVDTDAPEHAPFTVLQIWGGWGL